MTKKIEILNDDGLVIATFTTKSKNLRDTVYKYKRMNGIDEPTTWRESEVEVKAPDPRIPEFAGMKESTRRAYRNHIKNFLAQGGDTNSFESIKAYYEKIPTSSKQAFLYAISHLHSGNEEFKKKIKRLIRDSFDIVRQEREKRDKSDSISLKELQKIAKEYETDDPVNKFLVEWYAFSGLPLRADTLVHITRAKDKKSKKELNVFYPTKKMILMNHFKTVSSHGTKETPLTKEQVKLLKQGFTASGGDMLLNITADTLQHRLKKIFGHSVNSFRHAVITDAYKKLNDKEFKDLCWRLNTSVSCGLDTYKDE